MIRTSLTRISPGDFSEFLDLMINYQKRRRWDASFNQLIKGKNLNNGNEQMLELQNIRYEWIYF